MYTMNSELFLDKNKLRSDLRRRLRTLPPEEPRLTGETMAAVLAADALWQYAPRVLLFAGETRRLREIDTQPLINAALAAGKEVALPRCAPESAMDFYLIRSMEDTAPGAWSIREPAEGCPLVTPREADLFLVPCLAAGRGGERLGQGGGYYDRYFARFPEAAAQAVLVCRKELILDVLPVEAHDTLFSRILTQERLLLI